MTFERTKVGTESGNGRNGRKQAFTLGELLAVLAACALLMAVVWPALANPRERSNRVQCLSNLRSIGQALQQWGVEHEGRLPWRTPWCEGGTMLGPGDCIGTQPVWAVGGVYNNCWFQWLWISNELRTPKILSCPSDSQKRTSSAWGAEPDGFLSASMRNAAVSYFVGLDVFANDRAGLVTGDRNVRFTISAGTCSSGITYNGSLFAGPPLTGIGGGLHTDAGNFLYSDGSAQELSSQGFGGRWNANNAAQDNGSAHFLTPN